MAHVFIADRWLKNDKDGNPPTAAMKRSLANARDPMKASVPAAYRTTTYGRYDRWRCRWYATDSDGRRVERARTFARLADAEAFQAAMEDDIRRGRYHDPRLSRRTFAQLADEWLESKADVKTSTLNRYRRELRVYLLPKWGAAPVGDITARDIQEWVALLPKGGYPADLPDGREPRPLKPRTIRSVVRIVMGGVLSHALDEGCVTANPIDKVVTPRIVDDDDDMVLLSIPEVEELADEAGKRDPLDALIIRWQAYTGMRIGETFALQVRDMDLRHRRARVRHTWTDAADKGVKLGTPKSGKARTIVFPDFLLADMKGLCHGMPGDAFVFRAPRGGALSVNNWRSCSWTPALRRAGMEDEGIRIHDLRHTYASIAIAAGCDVKTLQSQLGHASATITLDTYARLWPERLDEVADAVGRARADGLAAETGR